jgi:hypothetical protein
MSDTFMSNEIDVDLPLLASGVATTEVTALSFGSMAMGAALTLNLFDGEATKNCLSALLQTVQRQSEQIERLNKLVANIGNGDMATVAKRLDLHENMITNLAHNIQGYVDPEEMWAAASAASAGKGSAAPMRPASNEGRRTLLESTAPSNFITSNTASKSRRPTKPLPMSPKVARGQLTNRLSVEAEKDSEADTGLQRRTSSMDSTPSGFEEGAEDANQLIMSMETAKRRIVTNQSPQRPDSGGLQPVPPSHDERRPSSSSGASPNLNKSPGLSGVSVVGSEDEEGGSEFDPDEDGSFSPHSNVTSSQASRKASATIARKKFQKAARTITFTNNLKRTSMLKTRAPKEFSVIQRLENMEAQLEGFAAAMGSAQEERKEMQDKMAELDVSVLKEWVTQLITSVGRRLQVLEQGHKATSDIESSEHVVAAVKKMQSALAVHVETQRSVEEEVNMGKLLNLQQRIVETSNSYHELYKSAKEMVMPPDEGNGEDRALKILAFQAKNLTIRHRLTHVDSEHMIQRNEYYNMTQHRTIMSKRVTNISNSGGDSTALEEAFENIQNRVDQCVQLNQEMWEMLNNTDKAAAMAWKVVSRMMQQAADTRIADEEKEERQQQIDIDMLQEMAKEESAQPEEPLQESKDGVVELVGETQNADKPEEGAEKPAPAEEEKKDDEPIADVSKPPSRPASRQKVPSREHSPERSALSVEIPSDRPSAPVQQSPRSSSLLDAKMGAIVQKMVDLHFEKLEIEDRRKGSDAHSLTADALRAVDEKLAITNKLVEDLFRENTNLKAQLQEKADSESVQQALRASRQVQSLVEAKADTAALENMEAFLMKCRKEVAKLRTSSEVGISSTRRILERKLKKVLTETMELKETVQSEGGGGFIGAGAMTMSSRDGTSSKVTWKSDKSKFVPGSSPVSKGGGGVVVTKGNFHMSLPPGFRGRTRMEDPMRSGSYEASSSALAKMFIDTQRGTSPDAKGAEVDSDALARPNLPKTSPVKPQAPLKMGKTGGAFWGDMDVKAPPNRDSALATGGSTAKGQSKDVSFIDIVK